MMMSSLACTRTVGEEQTSAILEHISGEGGSYGQLEENDLQETDLFFDDDEVPDAVVPIQFVSRTASMSGGEKVVYPVLQVVGGTGGVHQPANRIHSSASASSATSMTSKSRRSSSGSSSQPQSRTKSISLSCHSSRSSAKLRMNSDSQLQQQNSDMCLEEGDPDLDMSGGDLSMEASMFPRDNMVVFTVDQEEDVTPKVVLNCNAEDVSETEEFFLSDTTDKKKKHWAQFSPGATNNNNEWMVPDETPTGPELTPPHEPSPVTGEEHLPSASDMQGEPRSQRFPSSSDSPNLGFQRIASDQLIMSKKKPPKIVGNYLFGSVLGEGSYAKVKECLNTDNLCRLAVKILKMKRVKKIPNGELNLYREIDLLRRLDHKHCMKLLDMWRNYEKQKIYIVMEYCIGSLQGMLDYTPEHRFPVWQAHHYYKQLIIGMDYLKQKGVVHKDIKPANLLLTVDEILKITDFGVAEQINFYQGNDWCKNSRGTPKFQAPEIAQGNVMFHGFTADVWSSGVTLYNLVSGQYPFDGDTIMNLYDNIVNQPLKMPQVEGLEVDHGLEEVLRGLLEKDVEKRFKTDDLWNTEWFQKRFSVDETTRVHIPPYHGDIYRSLTVYPYLEQMYDSAVQSPTLSAQSLHIHEQLYHHEVVNRLKRWEQTPQHRLDVTSSDEALTFDVGGAIGSGGPGSSGSNECEGMIHGDAQTKGERVRGRGKSPREHGRMCRFKQRFCTIQ